MVTAIPTRGLLLCTTLLLFSCTLPPTSAYNEKEPDPHNGHITQQKDTPRHTSTRAYPDHHHSEYHTPYTQNSDTHRNRHIFPGGTYATDVTHDALTLWTRIAATSVPAQGGVASIEWRVARDKKFKRGVQKGQIEATSGFLYIAQVAIEELKADTTYYYEFKYQGFRSGVQHVKTLAKLKRPPTEYEVLPVADKPFLGKVGIRVNESVPYYPPEQTPPEGAPNVYLVLMDDLGFGSTSSFGGPVPTPNFDKVAKRGLRYSKFHTTALCSPTRAALLTGRNHHAARQGVVGDGGYPGYDGIISKATASVAEVLKQIGYNTLQLGKSHNTPSWEHPAPTGPFERWPSRFGFEKFYGFLQGEINQYRPTLYHDQTLVEPYLDNPDYTLNEDLANYTINYIEQLASLSPNKPWFVYYAPGATHAPHHVKKEWINKFKGNFSKGFDQIRKETFERQKQLGIFPQDAQLPANDRGLPAWDSLNATEKAVYERQAEVFAAFLAETDYQIGRVLDTIKKVGKEDNTLVLFILGDNGGSGEGGTRGVFNEMRTLINGLPSEDLSFLAERLDLWGSPDSYPNYAHAWGHAFSSPFQYLKGIASHYGGTANPLIASWPRKIQPGQQGTLRDQWHHVNDIAPTIYEAIGISLPSEVNGVAQKPLNGKSLLYSFNDPHARDVKHTQYFEMSSNRAIYHKGWVAATTPPILPWLPPTRPIDVIADYPWELYDVKNDPTQSKNLAAEYPEKLDELILLFYIEAFRNHVFPLGGPSDPRNANVRPSDFKGRNPVVFYNKGHRVDTGPNLLNTNFTITAQVTLKDDSESGVLATDGGKWGGYSLYVKQGVLTYVYNYFNEQLTYVRAPNKVSAGDHTLAIRFVIDGGSVAGRGGVASLLIDGAVVATQRIVRTHPGGLALGETFDVGKDSGYSPTPEYEVPNTFTGDLRTLQVSRP